MKKLVRIGVVNGWLFTLGLQAGAQETSLDDNLAADWQFKTDLQLNMRHFEGVEMDNQSDYSQSRMQVETSVQAFKGEKPGPRLSLLFEQTDYSGMTGVEDAQTMGLSLSSPFPVWEDFYGVASLDLYSGRAGGAAFEDSFYGNVRVGGFWRPSDVFLTGLSARMQYTLEDGAKLLMSPLMLWQFTDDWDLKLKGASGELGYRWSEQARLSGLLAYDDREYRLADTYVLAPEGALRQVQVIMGLKWQWQPDPKLRLEMSGGVLLYAQDRVFNKEGNLVGETESESLSPWFALDLKWLF